MEERTFETSHEEDKVCVFLMGRSLIAERLYLGSWCSPCLPPTVWRLMAKSFLRAVCNVARLLGNIITKAFTVATVSSGGFVYGQKGTRDLRINKLNYLSLTSMKDYFHMYYIITWGLQAHDCTMVRYTFSLEPQKILEIKISRTSISFLNQHHPKTLVTE